MPKLRSPRDIQMIVDAQVNKWSTSRKSAGDSEPVDRWPLITISREFGTQGAAMGKTVAERFGFSFWDQELVAAIAEETGTQETLLASIDEKTRNRLEDFIRETVAGVGGTAEEYVRRVARIAGVINSHGDAVVIGRGIQFIIDPDHVLRVRIIGPEGQRVASFAERNRLSAKEADRIVRSVERERQSFIRRHYRAEVGDPSHYDLVLNSGFFSLEGAAGVVMSAYAAKFGRRPD
jgi:cytidylate kinase